MLRNFFYISLMGSFLISHPSSLPQHNWFNSHLPKIACGLLGVAAHYGLQRIAYKEYQDHKSDQFHQKIAALKQALPSNCAPHTSPTLAQQTTNTFGEYKAKNERIEELRNQKDAHKTSAALSLAFAGAIIAPGFLAALVPQKTFAIDLKQHIGLLSAPLCGAATWFLASVGNILYKRSQIQKETAALNADFEKDKAPLIAQETAEKKLYEEKCDREAKEWAQQKKAFEARDKIRREKKQLNQKCFEDAIARNDLRTARECERAGANVNGDSHPNFSLAWAMDPQHNTVFHYLSHNPSFDVNKPLNGETPLMFACRTGKTEMVQKLLALANLDVNKKGSAGNTALMIAIEKEHSECAHHILLLRQNDLYIDAQNNDGRTALLIAIQKENLALVQELLGAGANPNIERIVSVNRQEIVTPDGRRGIMTTTTKETPFIVAFNTGFLPVIYELLNNSSIQISNEDMIQLRQIDNAQLRQHPRLNKPLFDAIANKSLEELDRALKEGCDINARDYALSSNPLQSKSFLGPNNMNLGTPAIHKAIANNDPAMVNHMLLKPALDILAPTMEGITPLMVAAHVGNDSMVHAILNHHRYAANQFQMLLAAQLPINARNLIGDTALHIAANAGHIGCFHALLRAGAFPMIKNKAGFTCLDLAKKKGYDGIVQLLSPNENVKEELEHIEYEEIRDAGGLVRLPEKDMKRLRDLHFSEEMINYIRSNLSRLSRGMISALIHGKIQLADAIIKAQDLEKKNFLNGLKNSILHDIEFFRKKHEEEKRKQEKDTKETNEDLPPLVDPEEFNH